MATNTAAGGSVFEVGARSILTGLGTPLVMLLLLVMIVLPLPPVALDLLFTFNIALAIIVLLAAIYAARPLEFAVFPSVLLISTLLRLGLNVASTRVVLLEGHTGTGAAGNVIEAFGDFVVGGNYAVGLVLFAILVVINFVVVTKGAGRIAEVTARFTLDAMPGKQMSIDADMRAGIIDSNQGRALRADIQKESQLYGAMDGAMKFVKGDAIAGIVITLINVIGGLIIGVSMHGMTASQSAQVYSLLSIGDGLVSQIPALLISITAGIVTTRVSDDAAEDGPSNLGRDISKQILKQPKALFIGGCVMLAIGLIPDFPFAPFLLFAVIAGTLGFVLHRQNKKALDNLSMREGGGGPSKNISA